jgi:hypothetical protein
MMSNTHPKTGIRKAGIVMGVGHSTGNDFSKEKYLRPGAGGSCL